MLDWDKYIAIADRFQHKAKWQDREDLRQDIIVRLADVARNNGHKPLTEGAMIRVAGYVVMAYWRDLMRKPTMLSLNETVEDGDSNSIELIETLADDKAIDLDAWLDIKRFLLGCPLKLVKIVNKRRRGIPLNNKERCYLQRFRQREQKTLF